LLVRHLVIFEDVLTALDEELFERLLRLADRARQPYVKHGFAVVMPKLGQAPLQALSTTEDLNQIVVKRQHEHRRARVALPSGSADQLIVDPAAICSFRAEDEQSAGRKRLVARRLDLREDRIP